MDIGRVGVEDIIAEVTPEDVNFCNSFLMLLWSLSVFLRKVLEWLAQWMGTKIIHPISVDDNSNVLVESVSEANLPHEIF